MKGQYIEVVIPNYHKLGGLQKKKIKAEILFSHSSGGQQWNSGLALIPVGFLLASSSFWCCQQSLKFLGITPVVPLWSPGLFFVCLCVLISSSKNISHWI